MKKQLKVNWSKKEDDMMYHFQDYAANGGYLHSMLKFRNGRETSILEELDKRGYDIKTLKISIDKKTEEYIQTHGEKKILDTY